MSQAKYTLLVAAILAAVSIFAVFTVEAAEFRVLELKELSIGYRGFIKGGYRPTINGIGIPDRTLNDEVTLFINIDFMKYFYWNHRVHGATDRVASTGGQGQYRDIGWQFFFGFRPTKFLSVEYEHHSQHVLDHKAPFRYPVEDSFGIKLHIFQDSRPSDTVF